MRFISKLSTKSLPASLTVLLNHANFSLDLSNLASSRSMSCQSSWLATGFPLAVFQSRFFQLFIQAGPSFMSLTDLITYWEFKTNSKGCWVSPNCSSFFKLSRKTVISISVLGGAQMAGTISKLLALPQAWRNGLVGDSIPALITELCLLLIQLELSLLMIAAELITLINLTYSYFEFNTQTQFILSIFELLILFDARLYTYLFDDEAESFTIKDYWSYFDKSDQTWLVIYVSSLFVPFISAKLTGLPPYPTFAELDQLFPF